MGFNQVLLTSCYIITQIAFGQIYEFTSPLRIGTTINSSADESNPVISSDGNTLYFVRTFDIKNTGGIYDQDIWYCKKSKNGWGPSIPLKALNNKLNNAVIAETIEESDSTRKSLYLISSYGVERDMQKGITMASRTLTDTLWIIQKKLPIPNLNIDGKYVSYTISKDQHVVILSYEGSDSEGEEDLYYSLKGPDGWTEPEHLGAMVNTPGFEISPFLSPSNDTLYFSSNGFKGYGDADIFYSVRKGKWNNWSKPVNLGKSINTSFFDAYFSLTDNCAIWSSNREGKDLDIWTAWSIKPPELILNVNEIKHVSEFQGNDGKISVEVVSGVKPFKYQWSNGLTTSDINSLRKGDYKLQVTDSIGQKINRTFTIEEPEATEQHVVRFPNIQYEFNKWTFVNDSSINTYDSLRLVAKLLEDYPNLIIELISHTDSRGEESRNLILSENRAKACYIYLVNEFKIDPRRIIPIGKGEAEPARWYDPELQQMVLLSEEYIQNKKNNEAHFEFLHQINRRTEGKVLRLDFNPNTAPEAPKSYLEFQEMP